MKRTIGVQISEELLNSAATNFIKTANEFSSRISITHGEHSVNAKSLLGFLSLMKTGTQVELSAEGEDAERALDTLSELLSAR
ncbi:MAG: HPr family phosphocarrier protein [Oscillibacter sp.]|nr:HPr family phosphocarrier protein [Oscillibacter sp.]